MFALLTACTSNIRDLTMTALAVDRQTIQDDGLLVEIYVTSATNLEQLHRRWSDTIRAEAKFCDQPSGYAVLSGGIYVREGGEYGRFQPLWESGTPTGASSRMQGILTYTIFLNAARKESPLSKPPQIAFDLSTGSRDVCVSLAGGYLFHSITSNVVTVPAAMIRDAITKAMIPQTGQMLSRPSGR